VTTPLFSEKKKNFETATKGTPFARHVIPKHTFASKSIVLHGLEAHGAFANHVISGMRRWKA